MFNEKLTKMILIFISVVMKKAKSKMMLQMELSNRKMVILCSLWMMNLLYMLPIFWYECISGFSLIVSICSSEDGS
jgi:hypothetical protein